MNHQVTECHTFQNAVEITSLTPHMHLRGKSMRYVAHFSRMVTVKHSCIFLATISIGNLLISSETHLYSKGNSH